MYFISVFFQGAKTFFAISGTVMSLVLIGYGSAAGGGMVFTIGGVYYLVSSLFHLYDSSKVILDIRKEISNLTNEIHSFSEENSKLHKTSLELKKIKDEFVTKTCEFTKTLEQSQKHTERLESLKNEYADNYKALKKEQKENLKRMIVIKDEYHQENSQLKSSLEVLRKHSSELESIQARYSIETTKLTTQNQKLEDDCIYLNKQLEKLVGLYNSTKKLLVELASLGDRYTSFATNIDTGIVKLDSSIASVDSVSTQLTNLLVKMKEKSFDEFDTNQDGVIDNHEFSEGLK